MPLGHRRTRRMAQRTWQRKSRRSATADVARGFGKTRQPVWRPIADGGTCGGIHRRSPGVLAPFWASRGYLANGLSAERLTEKLALIDELNARRAHFRILTGIEVDILEDGTLDQCSSSVTIPSG